MMKNFRGYCCDIWLTNVFSNIAICTCNMNKKEPHSFTSHLLILQSGCVCKKGQNVENYTVALCNDNPVLTN